MVCPHCKRSTEGISEAWVSGGQHSGWHLGCLLDSLTDRIASLEARVPKKRRPAFYGYSKDAQNLLINIPQYHSWVEEGVSHMQREFPGASVNVGVGIDRDTGNQYLRVVTYSSLSAEEVVPRLDRVDQWWAEEVMPCLPKDHVPVVFTVDYA